MGVATVVAAIVAAATAGAIAGRNIDQVRAPLSFPTGWAGRRKPLERESSPHFAKEHRWKNAVESKSADRSSRTRSVPGSSASRRSRQIGRTVKIFRPCRNSSRAAARRFSEDRYALHDTCALCFTSIVHSPPRWKSRVESFNSSIEHGLAAAKESEYPARSASLLFALFEVTTRPGGIPVF